ncbi:hypothetical protein [Chondromyces apiculatus]|uniref:Collagen triple helix repeat protein n=1 Tax=Chondromyces apiculatus DSM 436 TaxID=1192034 RepID=A0A017T6T1_9BACT|nr:hypothetical protein [Chondromyces apiculatus]EYF04717.1 Hypothetical protein CAP_4192 [Chondromyces apiculatus DSM 436]
MSSIRTIVRSTVLALSVALGVAPAAAFADEGQPAPVAAKGDAQGKQGEMRKGKPGDGCDGKPGEARKGKPGDGRDGKPGEARRGQQGGRKARGPGEIQPPMTAKAFQEKVEARIRETRANVEVAMEKHAVPAPVRAQVRKDMEAGAAAVREALKQVAADGQVSRDEAKKVRELTRDMRQSSREKLRPATHGKRARRSA